MTTTITTTIFVERNGAEIEVTATGEFYQPKEFQGYPGQGDQIRSMETTVNGEYFHLSAAETAEAIERMFAKA